MMVTAPEDRATSAACVESLTAMNENAKYDLSYYEPLSVIGRETKWPQGALYPAVSRRPNTMHRHLPSSDYR